MTNGCPRLMIVLVKPFAFMIACTEVPNLVAMELSVSPDFTT